MTMGMVFSVMILPIGMLDMEVTIIMMTTSKASSIMLSARSILQNLRIFLVPL
ncbi:hypothetical protein IP95_02314 [Extensimonas vulgaris]|uniref:Uncharacterized protein n=1 Tax=Extensimonas vulgaris TaxID=1031594 RepID=A0A369AKT5_9BURK|nr:hypothetical protein DFR45_1033 [Extensimonas vulgaris]TWI36584.1 hypothetical protein IP95_02314 [Extensimonas vulgaris]